MGSLITPRTYDLIVWDLHMPDPDGPAVYSALARRSPPRPAFRLASPSTGTNVEPSRRVLRSFSYMDRGTRCLLPINRDFQPVHSWLNHASLYRRDEPSARVRRTNL